MIRIMTGLRMMATFSRNFNLRTRNIWPYGTLQIMDTYEGCNDTRKPPTLKYKRGNLSSMTLLGIKHAQQRQVVEMSFQVQQFSSLGLHSFKWGPRKHKKPIPGILNRRRYQGYYGGDRTGGPHVTYGGNMGNELRRRGPLFKKP